MDIVDDMIKRRALFLITITEIYDNIFEDAESFGILLNGFLENYINDYFDLFNLIYIFRKDETGELTLYEEDEWAELLFKYLNYFKVNDTKNIIKLYDDIGAFDVDRITILAESFGNYIALISDRNVYKIKS